MFFRIVSVCLVLALAYVLYEIWAVRNYYGSIRSPDASFAVHEPQGNQSALTIVEFVNYARPDSKETHTVLMDYVRTNPGIRWVVRSMAYASPPTAEIAAETVLAAGLQGKFWEMDKALSEYDGAFDEKFFRETAGLYDIDYDRMAKDAQGSEVHALARDNIEAALRAKVTQTPALMVGDTLYQLDGPLTLPGLIRMVQDEKNRSSR